MKLRWALPAAVLLWAPAAQAEVTVAPAATGFDIDITDQASASELLDAVAAATGAVIKGRPEDATINANQLRNSSMERALRKLLPGAAFAVRYDDDGKLAAIIFLSPDSAGGESADGADSTDSGLGDDTPVDSEPMDNGMPPPDGSDDVQPPQ